ncbi:MIP/aquaporin family protein [Streptomyces marincola]|uniref:Aquaporin n=1 Tax=Streptomyces marincola TaxID=2878388 RepID=A0A1W7D506_9ACTN|nr:aquaporin [Streptomyces marincola]ARQ71660.1 aquaporin [Streptomyces marincola]
MSAETEPQPLAAEFLGTLVLVFFAVGSAVLAGEYIGTLGIALAFGLTLVALVWALGPVSGAHVNPAVTLGVLLSGRMGLRTAGLYWAAQFLGAVVGAALLFLVAHQVPGLETSEAFGTNGYGDRSAVGLSTGGAFVAEAMLTFLLVFVWLSVSRGLLLERLDGLPVGLALGVVHFVGIPLTGASVNPARSLGPALFAGGDALVQLWLFILAPLVGAALGVIAHRVVHPQEDEWLTEWKAGRRKRGPGGEASGEAAP